MDKKHRLFIAINLPAEIKKRLFDFREKWNDLPVRWVNAENSHITLLFIGYVSEDEAAKIRGIVRAVVSKHPPFGIKLAKIDYDSGRKIPRMIWAFGEENPAFAELEKDLRESLEKAGIKFDDKYADSLIHITLARIKQSEWRLPRKPEITEKIDLKFKAESVEVMESRLKRGGPEYAVLESVSLK